MRKLLRAVLRHKAGRDKGKTIKIFRYLWKELRTRQGHEFVHGEPTKKKSMLRRAAEKVLKR